MIGGIIVAAGESRRMGHPKALLKIDNTTFINYIIDNLYDAGIENIITVLGHDSEKISAVLDKTKSDIIINKRYKEGQLSSIVTGIDYFKTKKADGVMLCLVDHPFITSCIMRDMVSSFEKSEKSIVVPVYKGKRGHPVLFSRSIFPELIKASPEVGAREVIWNNEEKILELEVDDPGILLGTNTPEDYKKNLKWFKSSGR